jgi:beta-lactamase class D
MKERYKRECQCRKMHPAISSLAVPLRLKSQIRMFSRISLVCLTIVLLSACAQTRIKEHEEWAKSFEAYGIKDAGFIMRDNNHESIHYYNKAHVSHRCLPASTFKIFISLVGLETGVAPDDQLVIKWDSIKRKPEWDKDMNMKEALTTSSEHYYKVMIDRIGASKMQHALDTVKYGNMTMAGKLNEIWTNNSLQITPDEQTGFLKRLYFGELPFSERSQRIVKTLMLREQTPGYNLYYKTGTGIVGDSMVLWVVGFAERIVNVKEPKGSMNKSDLRYYPYFFAQNFTVANADTSKDWSKVRIDILHDLLRQYGAIPN